MARLTCRLHSLGRRCLLASYGRRRHVWRERLAEDLPFPETVEGPHHRPLSTWPPTQRTARKPLVLGQFGPRQGGPASPFSATWSNPKIRSTGALPLDGGEFGGEVSQPLGLANDPIPRNFVGVTGRFDHHFRYKVDVALGVGAMGISQPDELY